MARPLTLADGQLATTAGTVIAGSNVDTGRVNLILHNTGESEETVVLTFQRAGGTARRLARAALAQNEQMIVTGVPIQPDDTLLGVTTTASTVDYLVTAGNGNFRVEVLGADGTGKGTGTLRRIALGMEHLTDAELTDPG